MRLTTSEIAAATSGALHGPDVAVDGASIDSRSVVPDQLFVPVVAGRDGHDFITAALEAGAAAYLTARPPGPGTAVAVVDTAAALTALGHHARDRLPDRVIGVTGSVGKTSVKDLLAAALAVELRTAASVRSFNNELGVPLTLLNAPDDTEAVVVEMGARGIGHVAELCEVARPTVGVVTAVALAHTALFGSIEGVALAKGELVEALPADGTAVLSADDPLVSGMADRTLATVVLFGESPDADVTAEAVALDDDLCVRFRLKSPWGSAEVKLAVAGRHQVANALAAAAAALAVDVGLDSIVGGLVSARLSPWRMEIGRTPSGAVVINDAYNANPTSMEAALRALTDVPGGGRRVAVLGVMAELGPAGPAEHRHLAERAADLGIEVVAVGTDAYGVAPVADVDAAVAAVGKLEPGDAVLVKASRVAGLERVAVALLG